MDFDILIKNGKIIDGTGNPFYKMDIAIKFGRIAKMGQKATGSAANEIDATGMVVCPGFIDPHSHDDFALPFNPKLSTRVRQGITTSIIGNCGEGLAPVSSDPDRMGFIKKRVSLFTGEELDITWHSYGEYLAAMENLEFTLNMVPLVGFGPIRIAGGPGFEDRPPTPNELECMKEHVDEAMQAGAFGISTGLILTPQIYAKPAEVLELVKVVGKYGGLYFSHIRSEGASIIDALNEAIETTEKSGCTGVQIAHHKIAGKSYWGLSEETLRLMDDANTRGVCVTCDQYPYNRGMNPLITLLPPWVHIGGTEKIMERLQNPADRERIKMDITKGIEGWENWLKEGGWARIYISTVQSDHWKFAEGKSLAEITQIRGHGDEWQTLFDLLLEEKIKVTMTFELMGDEDIRRIMTGRYTMIGTDAIGVHSSQGKPHPRSYGTYPRVLGHYVREEGVLQWEDAIRRMTSLPAQRLGLWDRGLLREEMAADIVMFDPKTVIDKATYENPHQYPEGITHVIINGELVVRDEQQTEKMPGKIFRRPT